MFSAAGRFRFVLVLEVWIPVIVKVFPLKTGVCYAQVPFKIGFTVIIYVKQVLF
jgi:hypothetical protein